MMTNNIDDDSVALTLKLDQVEHYFDSDWNTKKQTFYLKGIPWELGFVCEHLENSIAFRLDCLADDKSLLPSFECCLNIRITIYARDEKANDITRRISRKLNYGKRAFFEILYSNEDGQSLSLYKTIYATAFIKITHVFGLKFTQEAPMTKMRSLLSTKMNALLSTKLDDLLSTKMDDLLSTRLDDLLLTKIDALLPANIDDLMSEKIDALLSTKIDALLSETNSSGNEEPNNQMGNELIANSSEQFKSPIDALGHYSAKITVAELQTLPQETRCAVMALSNHSSLNTTQASEKDGSICELVDIPSNNVSLTNISAVRSSDCAAKDDSTDTPMRSFSFCSSDDEIEL